MVTILYLNCCTFAGPDDMPAHIKSSMFGCTLMYEHLQVVIWHSSLLKIAINNNVDFCRIPITDGKLNMGTWQVSRRKICSSWTSLSLVQLLSLLHQGSPSIMQKFKLYAGDIKDLVMCQNIFISCLCHREYGCVSIGMKLPHAE